jgi:undecaprenyl-diphosphatase
MDYLQALILGIIQGLTEFLPVSSSGHLEIGKAILGVEVEDNLIFTVVVHAGTVCSTIIVFRKYILELLKGLLEFKYNEETKYVGKIALSMVPVGIVGVFFKDEVESLFATDNMMFLVGCCLLFTAVILAFTYYAKEKQKDVSYRDAFLIGIAQTCAILPGLSRSGSTIATGLLLGNKKENIARFSFLMVLVPIIGENILSLLKGDFTANTSVSAGVLAVGFLSAFVSGLLACSWMVKIVSKGKLIYFAIYCLIVGLIAIIW